MAYRKFRGDQLFTGLQLLKGEKVLVTEDDGRIIDIIDAADAGEEVLRVEGIISPGFINCHCHLELSHMKGLIPEKTGLIDFVFKVVTQRHFSNEEILDAISKGEEEMIKNGIVAVGDICNTTFTLQQKLQSNLVYYNFVEASGWLPSIASQRFATVKQSFDAFAASTQSALVPHAPYSVSEELWRLITPYYAEKTVTIHNQETAFEDEFFRAGTGDFTRMYGLMNIDNGHFHPPGKGSLPYYFEKLAPAKDIMLVHNTFTTEDDMRYAAATAKTNNNNLFWCVCINANKYIEDALPPVTELANGGTIVLGTDSLASNSSLSILAEMKTIQSHFPLVRTEHLLTWATSNGAKALQVDTTLGTFEKSKKPGVLSVDPNLDWVRRLL